MTALAVIVIGAAVVSNVTLQKVQSNRDLVSTRLQPAAEQSRALLTALVNQETGERGFVLTADEAFLRPYREGIATAGHDLAGLRRTFRGDDEVTRALQRVEQAASAWRREAAEPEIEAARRGAEREAEMLVGSGKGKTDFDLLRRRGEQLQRLIDDHVQAGQAADARNLTVMRAVNVGSRVVNLVLLILSAFLLREWVLVPVQRLRARMRTVADGTLEDEVLVDGPPEVVAIARDAESMRRRILSELDTSRAATEALSQHSPVVAGLRRELASSNRPPVTRAGPCGRRAVRGGSACRGLVGGHPTPRRKHGDHRCGRLGSRGRGWLGRASVQAAHHCSTRHRPALGHGVRHRRPPPRQRPRAFPVVSDRGGRSRCRDGFLDQRRPPAGTAGES